MPVINIQIIYTYFENVFVKIYDVFNNRSYDYK